MNSQRQNKHVRGHEKQKNKTDNELLQEAIKSFPDYPDCFFHFTKTDNPDRIKTTIECLKKFVREKAASNVSTSQVRNLYAKARALSGESELQLLRPQIAYLMAKQQSQTDSMKQFFLLLDDLIAKGIQLNDFLKVFEAIVAYHKYYGKKN